MTHIDGYITAYLLWLRVTQITRKPTAGTSWALSNKGSFRQDNTHLYCTTKTSWNEKYLKGDMYRERQTDMQTNIDTLIRGEVMRGFNYIRCYVVKSG